MTRRTAAVPVGLSLVALATLFAAPAAALGNDDAQMVFLNQTAGTVQVVTVGENEREQVVAELEPGESLARATLPGRKSLVRDKATGEVFGRYTAQPAILIAHVKANLAGANPPAVARPQAVPPRAAAGDTTGSGLTRAEADAYVELHNKVRAEVGTPPVQWSPELARFAQAWADECARTGDIKHRPYNEGQWAQKYGENIGWGYTVAGTAAAQAGEGWYSEKADYTPGTPIPEDFANFKAGHYTAMVWRNTTQVGAGKALIQAGEYKGRWLVVGNYNPSGNFQGQNPY